MDIVTFGAAIEAAKQGKRIARKGWNGKGMFVYMQVPITLPVETVPKMTSLPQSVKDEFMRRGLPTIRYQNNFMIVYPDNNQYGWLASPSDCVETDWQILD